MTDEDEPRAPLLNDVAREIALELAEATAEDRLRWKWPDDFNGDTIDRARSCAMRIHKLAWKK